MLPEKVSGFKQIQFPLILTISAGFLASIYSIAALLGKVPMSWFIFFGLLGGLISLNAWLVYAFFRNRHLFGLHAKVLIILWGSIVVWYWSFAPIYYFFTMNLDRLQLKWVVFAFLWEVPIIGGLFILVCMLLFRPIQKFVDTGKTEEPDLLYRSLLHFPQIVAFLISFFTILGYTFGAVQLGLFADHPITEQIKNVLNGVVVAIFLAAFYYLSFDALLEHTRHKLEKSAILKKIIQRKFYQKVLGVSLLVAFGGISLLGVYGFQLFQEFLTENLKNRMQINLIQLEKQIDKGSQLHSLDITTLKVGSRGNIFFTSPDEEIRNEEFSEQTVEFISNTENGFTTDLKTHGEVVVVYFSEKLDKKLVSTAFLQDFYSDLVQNSQGFWLVGLFIVGTIAGATTIFSLVLTRSVRRLSTAVKKAEESNEIFDFHIASGDELEELSHAFGHFINESKTSLAQLQVEKNKLETLVESLPVGISLIEAPTGKILAINKAGIEITGRSANPYISPDEYSNAYDITKENGDNYPPEETPPYICLKTGQSVTKRDMFIHRPDGTITPIIGTAVPFKDSSGEMSGVIVMFQDISKEYEIDRAKTEFVSLASHQLRTPLSIINWYSESLLNENIEYTENQKKYLHQIYDANQRMIGLVNSLLNVSRIDLGTFVIEPEPTNIEKTLREVLEELKLEIRKKDIKIITEFNNLPLIQADHRLLYIVFQNLLTNAIKYSISSGEVRVKTLVEGDDIQVMVANQGVGIPLDAQQKIFTKLFRADNVKELDTEGSGLGLYIVKSILYYCGGRIWFESVEDKGASFYISLPLSGMKRRGGDKRLV